MRTRTLLYLLIAGNVVAGLMIHRDLSHRPGEPAPPPMATLRLRDEIPVPSPEGAPAVPVESLPVLCHVVGPIAERSLAERVLRRARERGSEGEIDSTRVLEVRAYWVHVPRASDRDSALATARQLAAAGLSDYYVVTTGGEQNAISLGVFTSRENAERRRAQVAAAGFPVSVIERGDERVRYLVRISGSARPSDWGGWLDDLGRPGVRELPCPDQPSSR